MRLGLMPALLALVALIGCARAALPEPAPELPPLPASAWLNSAPLTLAALRGGPVLIEFWTFDCLNCRNTLPWVKQVHDRYSRRGLTVIAVHSPEFDRERDLAAIAAHVRALGITWPVLIDNEFAYWNAVGNRFWPAFLLIDPQGRIVARRIGELHAGDRNADDFERTLEAALLTSR